MDCESKEPQVYVVENFQNRKKNMELEILGECLFSHILTSNVYISSNLCEIRMWNFCTNSFGIKWQVSMVGLWKKIIIWNCALGIRNGSIVVFLE